jgi:penicillin amidase
MCRYRSLFGAIASVLLLSSLVSLYAGGELKTSQRTLPGLKEPVEILRDRWGIPHIYARNSTDLFFAQGFITANDRLFQLDLWRRTGTGKLAEVLGPNFIPRDRIARLVRFRGNWEEEWKSYSPDAKEIITAFVNGINEYIHSLNGQRPEEFRIAGFDPGLWSPEDVVARVAGLQMTGNMMQEVNRAQQVARLGLSTVEMLSPPDPPAPFVIPHGLDLSDITNAVLRDYSTAISAIRFPGQQGSNNWVVDGSRSRTGKPILANDPHRAIQLPSLRKAVHLVAPGWNVIGAGEPALPGVALGHNEDIAFGFTVLGIDQQDLYVEKTNPDNPTEYLYKGEWKKFRIEQESILVGGGGEAGMGRQHPTPEAFDLKFTDHGPVIHEDAARHRAYALRWVGELPGTAGYLGALGLARARNWQQFQTAASAYKVPSENLVYADRRGNIGWIAGGLAPVRNGWQGLFPVPGDNGEYEWGGYLSSTDHPTQFNPPQHFIITANNNILPHGYSHQLAYYWASPERYQRILQLLSAKPKFDISDFQQIQNDTVSLIAQDFVRLLNAWHPAEGTVDAELKAEFTTWNGDLAADSKLACIFEIWSARLSSKLTAKLLPGPRTNPRTVLANLAALPEVSDLLSRSLDEALEYLERRMGPDQSGWSWGRLHHAHFRHPLSLANEPDPVTVPPAPFGLDSASAHGEHIPRTFDLRPVPRPGDANTVNATGGGPNFTEAYGASYRQIIDVADWDRSVMTNAPGESGVPGDKHYSDLLDPWAKGEYHPMPFSRKAVEEAAEERISLVPGR